MIGARHVIKFSADVKGRGIEAYDNKMSPDGLRGVARISRDVPCLKRQFAEQRAEYACAFDRLIHCAGSTWSWRCNLTRDILDIQRSTSDDDMNHDRLVIWIKRRFAAIYRVYDSAEWLRRIIHRDCLKAAVVLYNQIREKSLRKNLKILKTLFQRIRTCNFNWT